MACPSIFLFAALFMLMRLLVMNIMWDGDYYYDLLILMEIGKNGLCRHIPI